MNEITVSEKRYKKTDEYSKLYTKHRKAH